MIRLVPAWVFLFILPFTHTVALRLLALFTAFALAAWQWGRTREPGLRELLAWPWIVLWALLPLVLAPFAVDPRYALGEIKTEIGYGLLALLVFFAGVRSERALRLSLGVLLAAFAVLAIWIIASHAILGTWKETSTFGGMVTYTTYLVTVGPMLIVAAQLGLFGRATDGMIAALALLGLCAAFLAEQRGFWLAALVQLGVGLAIAYRTGGLGRRGKTVWLLAATVLGFAALAWITTGVARFGYHAEQTAVLAGDPRLRYWGQWLEWISAQPLTGYGFGRGTMPEAFPEEVSRFGMFWHAHNIVLNYGFQLGLAGVVAIIGLFASLFAYWLRLARSGDALLRAVATAGALVVVGVFARNMTNDLFQRDLSLMFWALTGMLAGFAAARRREPGAAAA